MSITTNEHKVFLYKNDFNTMCTEVYRHQRIETGGNLFGLWTTSGNAVVHVVVGPGRNCKRTDVSFNQDVEYMKRVGEFLNEKFMLCHIGEWHSHHHLTLNKPSDGDRRTVRNNYPQGMKKFLVIIANIKSTDRIILSPYFFTNDGYACEKAEFQVLDVDSPFTMDSTIAMQLDNGSENQQSEPMDATNNHPPTSRDGSRRNASQQQSSSGNSCLASNDNRTASQRNSSSVNDYAGAVKRGIEDASAGNASTTPPQGGLTPPPSYPGADSSRQQNGRNPSSDQAMETGEPHMSGDPSASETPTTANSSSPNLLQIGDEEKKTKGEIILKKVFDEIHFHLYHPKIDIDRNRSTGVIEMKFKHQDKSWLIEFPKRFPEQPAKIFCCYHAQNPNRTDKCYIRKPESLNNYIDILLSIKKICRTRGFCNTCDKMTAESLTHAGYSLSLFLTEKGKAMLEELYEKTKGSIADPGSFNTQIKYDVTRQDEATLEVSFKHSSKLWVVTLTSTFPDSPAKVNYERHRRLGSLLKADYFLREHLDSASKILLAVSQECSCEKCKEIPVV